MKEEPRYTEDQVFAIMQELYPPKTAAAPAPKLAKKKKKKVHVSFSCEEDLARAILRIARDHGRNRSNTVESILRHHVIESPARLWLPAFPPEQDLELWVWANIQARERGEAPPSPEETLVVSKDGENIIRLDYRTAA